MRGDEQKKKNLVFNFKRVTRLNVLIFQIFFHLCFFIFFTYRVRKNKTQGNYGSKNLTHMSDQTLTVCFQHTLLSLAGQKTPATTKVKSSSMTELKIGAS
jgi:hypothetical protein